MLWALVISATAMAPHVGPDEVVAARAQELHARAIVVDTHDDTTMRLVSEPAFDLGARNSTGSIDISRMRQGGLDALFFSIYMPGDVTGPLAVKRALQQIDKVREAVRAHPRELMLATSVTDIRRAVAERKIAALMGMEGGHMIDADLGMLRTYAALGVRYMTLTHSRNTTWADSSGDTAAHNGLTPFGKDVVRELNRLGVMVDVSHVSDKTFYDTLEVTTAPVIASHSSCRALSNSPRNMTDDMLRALARNGGVIMINYHLDFISEAFRTAKPPAAVQAQLDGAAKQCGKDFPGLSAQVSLTGIKRCNARRNAIYCGSSISSINAASRENGWGTTAEPRLCPDQLWRLAVLTSLTPGGPLWRVSPGNPFPCGRYYGGALRAFSCGFIAWVQHGDRPR